MIRATLEIGIGKQAFIALREATICNAESGLSTLNSIALIDAGTSSTKGVVTPEELKVKRNVTIFC
jgi:hypothetical protein